ncbi:MAG TPA: zf-HC2 domain-containing protein [Verrucomicrobiae bacterium]|nr:zf-HC2 domain-containing protein [Verrucomicrobiae bacterium]
MNCPDPQTISEFADGEFDTNNAVEVERHIAQCASCRQLLGEMQWLERRGRAALEAIEVRGTTAQNVVYPKTLWLRWARPLSLAAAVVAIFIGVSLTFHYSDSHQTSPLPHPVDDTSSKSEEDAAFAQWLEPYRNLNIPLVSMETAANYDPAPILPYRPDSVERN